jgi:hypothetical protein
MQDFIAQCNGVAVARYAAVPPTLADKAKAGDKDAANLIRQEVVTAESPAADAKDTPPRKRPEDVIDAFMHLAVMKKRVALMQENADPPSDGGSL